MQKRVEEKKKELEKYKEESPNFATCTGIKNENLNVSSHHSRRSSIRTPRNQRYFEKVYFLKILNTVHCIIHYNVKVYGGFQNRKKQTFIYNLFGGIVPFLFSTPSLNFEVFCSKQT